MRRGQNAGLRGPLAEIKDVSPSEIDTFGLCLRKWAGKHVEKIPTPPSPTADFGTAVHKQYEPWFLEQRPPDDSPAGLVARAGLHHYPAPAKGLLVEQHITAEFEGWKFHGYADLQATDVYGEPWVYDHKTTSAGFKWAKSEEELRNDTQANVYALAVMQRTGAPIVKLRWVYHSRTKPYRTRPVDITLTRAEVEKFASDTLVPAAREIHRLRVLGVRMADLPPEPRSCEAYGGCPFKERCNLTPEERLRGFMSEQTLQEKLAARVTQAKGVNPQEANKAPSVTTVAAPATAPAANPLMAKLMAAKPAATPATPAASPLTATTVTATPATPVIPTVTTPIPATPRPPPPPPAQTSGQAAELPPITNVAPPTCTRGFTLMIDASFGKGGAMPLYARDIVERAHERVRSFGVADYRLADFGKGPGMLADQVRKVLGEMDLTDATVILDTHSSPELAVVDVFTAAASTIVVGR